ncbi:MAG: hypothetical protein L0228_16115, partial [Planctomycetes bacterium]|nr:hypothetical protein [Planctomycetota bacterium]
MKRGAMAGMVVTLMMVGLLSDLAQAVAPVGNVKWVGSASDVWTAANAWQNTTTSTTGDASTIFGQSNGSDGFN